MPLSTNTCKTEVITVTRAMEPYSSGASSLASTTDTTKEITWEPQRSIKRQIRLDMTFCLLLSIKHLRSPGPGGKAAARRGSSISQSF